jgi:predicted phosphodiesterase
MNKVMILVWGILILSSCEKKFLENASPTYGGAFFSNEQLTKKLFENQFPMDGLQLLDQGWELLSIDSMPGIDRELPAFEEREEITLPHRVTLPNHSFWYRTFTNLQEGYLIIDSDDGAQLWIDGNRIRREEELEFFKVEEKANAELIIRGVNNAMAGGLRKVFWISKSDVESWNARHRFLKDSLIFQSKIQTLQKLELLDEINFLSIQAQQEKLRDYPILMSEPVLISSADGDYFVRWVSEKTGEANLIFEDGSVAKINSENEVFTFSLEDYSNHSFRISQEKSFFGPFEFSIPKPKESVRLAVWADSQGGWETFQTVSDRISSHQPDLSIGAGDLVNNGSETYAFPRFLQKLSTMNSPQLLVPGNHDYDGFYDDLQPRLLQKYIQRADDKSYGQMTIGSASILTLDPNLNFPVSIPEGTEQRMWFKDTMESEEWNSSPWKIIVLHQPPYSQGWPGYQGEKAILDLLEPYFHQGKIDLVIAGHTHDYERLTKEFSGYSVNFLIIGGAGGSLEPEGKNSSEPQMDKLIKKHHLGILEVDTNRLSWKVYGLDEQVLDSLIVDKSQ